MPHAIQMTEYGPPFVLEWIEMESRSLGSDEVRLDVLAVPVNRADVEIRSGTWPIRADDPWPYTPGLEFVGDIDPIEMAALGLAAVTALEGVRRLDVEAGDRVVVHGATGGVGSNAVQLIDAFGGIPIATTRRAEAHRRMEAGDHSGRLVLVPGLE